MCGRILALNRKLYDLPRPTRAPHEPKEMPFKAERRHQNWTVDVRYIDHHLDDERVYCILILENYSRAVLASALSRTPPHAARHASALIPPPRLGVRVSPLRRSRRRRAEGTA